MHFQESDTGTYKCHTNGDESLEDHVHVFVYGESFLFCPNLKKKPKLKMQLHFDEDFYSQMDYISRIWFFRLKTVCFTEAGSLFRLRRRHSRSLCDYEIRQEAECQPQNQRENVQGCAQVLSTDVSQIAVFFLLSTSPVISYHTN